MQFIPMINLESSRTWFWKNRLGFDFSYVDTVMVRAVELKKSKPLYLRVKNAGGFNNFLDFDGKVMMHGVMDDDILDYYNVEEHIDFIEVGKPSHYTTIDGYCYFKDSLRINYNQIHKILEQAKQIKKANLNGEAIGLAIGANVKQVEYCANRLRDLGYEHLAFPCGDYIRKFLKDDFNDIKNFASILKRFGKSVTLIGIGSPSKMLELSFVDLLSSLSWKVVPQNEGMYYTKSGKVPFGKTVSVDRAMLLSLKFIMDTIKENKFQLKLTEVLN